MSESNFLSAIEVAAFDALLEDGFSITIRKVKSGFVAECRNYDNGEPRAFYGKGETWQTAVEHAANQWARSGEQ